MLNKPFFHKLNLISDWILRIVVVNLLLITSSLLVFTLYPAIYASYKLFSEWRQGLNTPMFNGFWTYFKEDFKRKILISITLVSVLLIGIYSLYTYNDFIKQNEGVIYLIGYYIVLMFLIGFVLTTLLTVLVLPYFKEASLTNIYKLSLYLMARYFHLTLVISILWILPMILFIVPQLMVIYVIAGLSFTVILWVFVSIPMIKFLERMSKHVQTRD